jgi:cephalosporin hydroxylase
VEAINEPTANDPNDRPVGQDMQSILDFDKPTPAVPRSFKTAFEPGFLADYHQGTMKYTYKGVPCLKDPIDLAVYMKLIWDYRPGTILEIGSFEGGAASLYADLCHTYGMTTRIVTCDFRNIQGHVDPRIKFVQADALDIATSDLHVLLRDLPHPWLIIEDSAHTQEVCYAVLDYFRQHLLPGEIIIIEDGVIEDQGANCNYNGGPNLAIHNFFMTHPQCFRVMNEYADFFGKNATFNPNGYLQKL